MTHKERIRAAFEHREADRVPLFEQSVASDVASEILGREAYTGTTYLHYQEACAWMRGEQAYREFEAQHEKDVLDLAKALGFDMLHRPWRLYERPAAQLDECNFLYGDPDGDNVIRRFDPQAKSFHVAEQHYSRPPPESPDGLAPVVQDLECQAAEMRIDDPWGTYAWHARMIELYGKEYEVTGSGGIAIPYDEVWLTACLERPDFVERYLDAQLIMTCKSLQAQAAIGIRVIWGGGDLAGKNGPFYGPRIFRRILLPRLKTLTAKCRELGLLYLFRTDGDIWPIEREFFVESGIDGYGEIDYESGMDLDRLKPRYGDRITFWGNVPCGTILHHGAVKEVVEFTKHILDVAAPGGGLIVGSSNSIIPGTPARNVMAMVETVVKYGRS
jgi:hypothetical protein